MLFHQLPRWQEHLVQVKCNVKFQSSCMSLWALGDHWTLKWWASNFKSLKTWSRLILQASLKTEDRVILPCSFTFQDNISPLIAFIITIYTFYLYSIFTIRVSSVSDVSALYSSTPNNLRRFHMKLVVMRFRLCSHGTTSKQIQSEYWWAWVLYIAAKGYTALEYQLTKTSWKAVLRLAPLAQRAGRL